MIKSFDIENFRCYKKIGLKNLRRVNVIVGANGSGKTALLEALYLGIGAGPELTLRLRAWRGLGDPLVIGTLDQDTFASLWRDLFFNFDTDLGIVLRVNDSQGQRRTLQIYFAKDSSYVLPLGASGMVSTPTPLNFAFKFGTGEPEVHTVELTDKGIRVPGGTKRIYNGAFISPLTLQLAMSQASMFSDLSQRNQEGIVIDALRAEFPVVENVTTETSSGRTSLWAKLRSMNRKIPIELLSAGIAGYFGTLIAIAHSQGGLVLIDEIEYGIHYTLLEKVWRRIHSFALKFETQVFASTHSRECLNAMRPLLRGHESEFCLLRASQTNGASKVEQFDGKTLEAAINQEVEVRGDAVK